MKPLLRFPSFKKSYTFIIFCIEYSVKIENPIFTGQSEGVKESKMEKVTLDWNSNITYVFGVKLKIQNEDLKFKIWMFYTLQM